MPIVSRSAPVRQSSGRAPRLSEEDIKNLAEVLKTGKWAGDDEPAQSRSSAYQRANAAKRGLVKAYPKIESLIGKGKELTTAAIIVKAGAGDKSEHYWQVGVKPVKPKAETTPTPAPADGAA